MAISTNSVIHYTDTLDKIKGILQYGFKVKYCVENLMTKGNNEVGGAYPMVSFCDIPLSAIGSHVDAYGFYGIGLSKSWAKNKGLNPVLYIDRDSNIGEAVYNQIKIMIASKGQTNSSDRLNFTKIIPYAKNYDGPLVRGRRKVNNYKFYNEREWRYVPSREQLKGNKLIMSASNYLSNKNKFNLGLKEVILPFEPKDISYILVKSESEIVDMVKHLRIIFDDVCTSTQLQVLFTRIIAIEHITNDF